MESTTTMRRFALVALVTGGVAALALACGGDSPMEGGNGGGGGVASVSVTPAEDSIGIGETAQFSASAEDANGSSVSASFTWSSTNTSVATVDDQGVATGEGEGMAQIVASAEGEADTAELTVSGQAEAKFLVGDNYFEDPQGRQNTNASVELTLGDTVRWEWVGNNQHNVTSGEGQDGNSGDGVPSNGSAVGSSTKSSGNYEFVPDVTGTWEFYCDIHPNQMYGSTFTVTSSSSSSVSADRLGAADLEPGDVIRPEDSHIVFIYRGEEGGE